MSLRTKLAVGQRYIAVRSVSQLGDSAQTILKDNYASVLAAQRMKESVERLDSGALFIPAGQAKRGRTQIAEHLDQFERQLKIQEANITEPGEDGATAELRHEWDKYKRMLTDYLAGKDPAKMEEQYFQVLQPQFVKVKDAADRILEINQDAMLKKAGEAEHLVGRTDSFLVLAALLAVACGAAASLVLTNLLLRPLSVLTLAVNRLGQKDFAARAMVSSRDEIGQLAEQFNQMAEHLQEYRESSLGELLLAQRASQATIDSIPDPVIVFNADGNILEMNSEAENLWRDNFAGAEAKTLDTLPPEVRATLNRAKSHVLGGKGGYMPGGFEDAFSVGESAAVRWFLLRATPVYEDQGKIAGVTAILQDVTKLHRLDELKNNLVATVAHEFRTPLTSLRMAVHLCLEGVAGPLTEKQGELLQAAREECERLQGTVDELLDLARIQSGRVELEPKSVPAAELIETAVTSLRSAAAEKNINLQGDAFLVHDSVSVDTERMQIVFSNLIVNALRHTPEQGIVRVRGLAVNHSVRFEISDTGDGIPKEYQSKIFERFFRVPAAG